MYKFNSFLENFSNEFIFSLNSKNNSTSSIFLEDLIIFSFSFNKLKKLFPASSSISLVINSFFSFSFNR
jgi:hypothetical protein